MREYLTSMTQLGEQPSDLSEDQYAALSDILQEGVLARLETIQSQELRLQVHELACLVLTQFFSKPRQLDKLKISRKALSDLALASYLEDPQSSARHKENIEKAALLFLRSLAAVQPSEILASSDSLLRLMRQEYVFQQRRLDFVCEQLGASPDSPRSDPVAAGPGKPSSSVSVPLGDASSSAFVTGAQMREFVARANSELARSVKRVQGGTGAVCDSIVSGMEGVTEKIESLQSFSESLQDQLAHLNDVLRRDFKKIGDSVKHLQMGSDPYRVQPQSQSPLLRPARRATPTQQVPLQSLPVIPRGRSQAVAGHGLLDGAARATASLPVLQPPAPFRPPLSQSQVLPAGLLARSRNGLDLRNLRTLSPQQRQSVQSSSNPYLLQPAETLPGRQPGLAYLPAGFPSGGGQAASINIQL